MQNALYDRGTFDDLQPLPKLDFLDPKYSLINGTEESSIPYLKIEEAHLILAEAALADGQVATAQGIMKDIINLVATRPTLMVDDQREGRPEDNPGSRPDASDIMVAASKDDPLRAGLVLDRGTASVNVPTVSGTSVTADMVDMLNTEDEALEMLYLMRQEIFLAEGRRLNDLGIRYVVSETEEKRNPNINEGDASTLRDLPSFIEALITDSDDPSRSGLDDFTYDATNKTCIIKHNLNKILVQNKTSDSVLPFH